MEPLKWEQTKTLVRETIIQSARKAELLTYDALCTTVNLAGAPMSLARYQKHFHRMLYEISSAEVQDNNSGVLLTAIVVGKTARPGDQFFPLIRKFRPHAQNLEKAWAEEIMRIAQVFHDSATKAHNA
jgi:hypothetical protein